MKEETNPAWVLICGNLLAKLGSLDIDQIESKSLSDLPIHRPHSICVLVYLCICVFVYLCICICIVVTSTNLNVRLCQISQFISLLSQLLFSLIKIKNFNTGIRVKLKKWFQHARNVHREKNVCDDFWAIFEAV